MVQVTLLLLPSSSISTRLSLVCLVISNFHRAIQPFSFYPCPSLAFLLQECLCSVYTSILPCVQEPAKSHHLHTRAACSPLPIGQPTAGQNGPPKHTPDPTYIYIASSSRPRANHPTRAIPGPSRGQRANTDSRALLPQGSLHRKHPALGRDCRKDERGR